MVWSKFMTSWGLSSPRDLDRPREALEMPMRSWVRKIWSWVERFGGFLDISCWFLLILGLFIYIYNYIYILPNCACWVIFCQRFDVLPPDFSSKKTMQSEIRRIYSPYWWFTENCNLMRLSIAWFEQYHMSPIQTGCSLSLALLIHIFCS